VSIERVREKISRFTKVVAVGELYPHEEVVVDRRDTLESYLRTLKPYIIVPSIIACSETYMIIDGHHRLSALKRMGIRSIAVTFLDYKSDAIVTDVANPVSKETLLLAAQTRKLLPPKSSFHHIRDDNGYLQPIILLSELRKIDL